MLVELSPGRRIVSITLANPGDRAVTFQTQTLAWDQPNGVDRYAETDDLIVVPPIATINAGGTQILRVTLRGAARAQEQAYRLILEDVTELTAPSSSDGAINIHVNHELPVFVAAPGKPRPQPRLGPCTSPTQAPSAGTGCIRLDNDGNRYVAIKSLIVGRRQPARGAQRRPARAGRRLAPVGIRPSSDVRRHPASESRYFGRASEFRVQIPGR